MNEKEFELALAALIAGALHLGLGVAEISRVLEKANENALDNLPWENERCSNG